jgi:hypothetical protein
MRLANLMISLMLLQGMAVAAETTGTPPARAAGSVIDLGQLEVEGEIRRPNINWVDSQKRVKDMLPGFHQAEFKSVEDQLLKPASIDVVKKKLKQQGDTHARN